MLASTKPKNLIYNKFEGKTISTLYNKKIFEDVDLMISLLKHNISKRSPNYSNIINFVSIV